MRRGQFEERVDSRLGVLLARWGFRLAPQTPSGIRDLRPRAIFEVGVEDLARLSPGFLDDWELEVDHLDLTFTWDATTGVLDVEFEGIDLAPDVGPAPLAHDIDESLSWAAEVVSRAFGP